MQKTVFHLKRQWFDLIWSGEKTIEYREIKPYWTTRLTALGQSFLAEFVVGYARGGRRILAEVFKVDIGPCPYAGWDDEYYRIHFRIIERQDCAE